MLYLLRSVPRLGRRLAAALAALGVLLAPSAAAQTTLPDSLRHADRTATDSAAPPTLTLEEALDIALSRNYSLRNVRLDVENAEAQIQEAWGQVFPQIEASAGYTRNIVTANPFAGSDITGLFAGGNSTDWVAFNERARTDDDPSTNPITFQEFRERQQEGREAAGIRLGGISGNPFSVENQFISGISVRQTLYDGSTFAAIKGAQALEAVNQRALDRQQQVLVDSVRGAYYRALLAQERARVAELSVDRAQETLQEIVRQVSTGTAPKTERLSAQVQVANQRTQLVQARNQLGLAYDNLKLVIGLPVEQPLQLEGALETDNLDAFRTVSADQAVVAAIENRPDIERARLAVELRQVQQNITQAEYYPNVSAVMNFNYTGRVPDNRTNSFMPDPNDPFTFATQTSGFFGDEYWNPSLSVGLELSWTIFSGFQRDARIEQDQVAINRARLQYDQLRQAVRLEVQAALRSLRAARQRIQAQETNLETAETNYRFTRQRLQSGLSSQLQLRDASQQLDQSRLNYLRAVYDYLAARSAFQTAIGEPLAGPEAFEFTRK